MAGGERESPQLPIQGASPLVETYLRMDQLPLGDSREHRRQEQRLVGGLSSAG